MELALGPKPRSSRRLTVSLVICAAFGVATLTPAGAAQASGSVATGTATATATATQSLYAYPDGAARSPSSCPRTSQAGYECTLTQALARVRAGGTILLAVAGKSGTYYGNFTVRTRHTSARAPVTIRPMPGVSTPRINGDGAGQVRCPTRACDGAVITVAPHVFLRLKWLEIIGGSNKAVQGGGGIDDLGTVSLTKVQVRYCTAQIGGGIVVGNGARLTVVGSVFFRDRSVYFGGAIDSGSYISSVAGSGNVAVSGSTFTADHSQRGGAINSGDGGTGTLTVTRSTFANDSASVHGGAIDSADSGKGTLKVTDSTFTNDTARYGGAIDNADSDGTGTLTVTGSTFAGDTASHGGAIDNAERGNGTVTVRTSTFYANRAQRQGSVIDTGGAHGTGSVLVLNTTINNNLGKPAITRWNGTLQMAGSILAGSPSSARCTRSITDGGYNLISNGSANCGFIAADNDLIGVWPRLSQPRKNGGPTLTMMPFGSSPVLEQIPDPAVTYLGTGKRVAALCPVPDQRGDRGYEAVGCAIGSVDPASGVPVVTSLGSSIGPAAGRTTIAIHGGNFKAKATVRFGAVKAHVNKLSATLIQAVVPPLPQSDTSGTVAVTVKNPSGRSSPYRAAAIYTYYTPDWSSYLAGAAHSSYNPGATSISVKSMPGLRPAWQWQPPASPNLGTSTDDASPIAYNGVVYVGLEDGYMYAISEATQQILWSAYLGLEVHSTCSDVLGIISTATVAVDPATGKPVVYVNAPDGYLYALDAATGAVVWKSVVGIPSTTVNDYYAWGSPTVANGKVYIGIASNCDIPLVQAGVLAFNQRSGQQVASWYSLPQGLLGGSVWSSVAVLPNGDVVATTGNADHNVAVPNSESIVLLDGSTLKLLAAWRPQSQVSGDSDFGGSPTVFTAYPHGVATTMVGACNKNGIYYALRANDMAAGPLWTHRMGVPTTGPESDECNAAAIWNGHYLIEGGGSQVVINGVTHAGSVQALDPTTGKPVWQTGLTGWIVGSPAEDGAGVIAAPTLYSPTGVSGVYLLSAKTGKKLGFISTEPHGLFAQPVFDGDKLLVGDDSSFLTLTAYGVPTSDQPLSVSPATITPASTATLTLTVAGGLKKPANVIVSGSEVVVQSVTIDSSTTATVQVKVLSHAIVGAKLDVTVAEPGAGSSFTTYSCSQCLTVG